MKEIIVKPAIQHPLADSKVDNSLYAKSWTVRGYNLIWQPSQLFYSTLKNCSPIANITIAEHSFFNGSQKIYVIIVALPTAEEERWKQFEDALNRLMIQIEEAIVIKRRMEMVKEVR